MIRINSMHISMVYLWVSMAIPMCMALMSIICKIDPPPLQLYGIAGEDVFYMVMLPFMSPTITFPLLSPTMTPLLFWMWMPSPPAGFISLAIRSFT